MLKRGILCTLLTCLSFARGQSNGWNQTLCSEGVPAAGEQVTAPVTEAGEPLYSLETTWSPDLAGCKNKDIGCLNIQVVLNDASAVGSASSLFLQVTYQDESSDDAKAAQGVFVSKPRSARYINCDLGRNSDNNAITQIGVFGKLPRTSYVWTPKQYNNQLLKDFKISATVSESADGTNFFLLAAPVPLPPFHPLQNEDELRNPFALNNQFRPQNPNQNRPLINSQYPQVPNQQDSNQYPINQNINQYPHNQNQYNQNPFNQNSYNQNPVNQNPLNQNQHGAFRPGNNQWTWNDATNSQPIARPNNNNNNNNNQWGNQQAPNQQWGNHIPNPNAWGVQNPDANNNNHHWANSQTTPNQHWANQQWGNNLNPNPSPNSQWGYNPWGSTLGPQGLNPWSNAFPGFVNPPNVNQFMMRPGFAGRPMFGGFNYAAVNTAYGGFPQLQGHQGQQGQQGQQGHQGQQQSFNPYGNRDPYTASNTAGHELDDGRTSQPNQ